MARPLDGIVVVSLEQAVAAPFASRQLADLGARVIKIERPGAGDFARGYDATVKGLSSHFVWLNRSKESLALDLKHPRAGEVLARLVGRADVFIQNLAPGAAERLGLGARTLRQRHPRLTVCDISGYGGDGPYSHKKAYDLLVQCETGVVAVTGTGETPSKTGISIADIAAGMYAYSGVLTALYQREKTGQGAALEVSMFEALGEWMGYPAYYTAYGGAQPPRSGASHSTICPYGPFAAGDGKTVFVGIQNEREWESFCRHVLRRPELARDSRYAGNASRNRHRAELEQTIAGIFSTLTSDDLVARLDGARIANARLNDPQEFWDHPQLKARSRWRTIGSPAGELQALIPPVTMEGQEARMDPVPAVGEHTRNILEELGFDAPFVAALERDQAI